MLRAKELEGACCGKSFRIRGAISVETESDCKLLSALGLQVKSCLRRLTGKILSPKELAIRYSVFNELLLQGIVSSRLWGEVKGNRERRRAELEVKIPAPSTSSGPGSVAAKDAATRTGHL